MTAAERYEPVAQSLPADLPPITRDEAAKAARRIFRKFGKLDSGRRVRFDGEVRRVWISAVATSHDNVFKGWGRLIHDVSHRIHSARYPSRRPHDPLHAALETEVAAYVAASGWLLGALRTKPKAKPSLNEKRARALVQTETAIARWESKLRRAKNALRKLANKRRRLMKVLSAPSTSNQE